MTARSMAYQINQPRIMIHTPEQRTNIWPSVETYQPYLGITMGGSTSDDQSIFDQSPPQDCGSKGQNISESSASPPDLQGSQENSQQPYDAQATADAGANPRLKRIACIICRRRKLKCDGERPTCSTCARLKHECGYDETRKKSGPKRGYVKELEKRLKQIENQLESGGQQDRDRSITPGQAAFDPSVPAFGMNAVPGRSPSQASRAHRVDPESADSFPWEMMSLGLEEPLPHQDMIDELHNIFFEKLHPSMPMIHKYRYLAAMNLAPSMRPPVALRYAIWAYACSASDKYTSFVEMFYQRSRKYLELDEMKGFGEQLFTVAHVQAWIIIANYEFKMIYFPRAWMSVGRAVRLAQMIGLYRVDGGGLEVKECLSKPKDWVDEEERRRTFWAAYCFDRWASIGTGWPMNIDERDIHTLLPAPDDNFERGKQIQSFSLGQALSDCDPSTMSSYSSLVLMACIIGKTLTHLHRSESKDDALEVENGEFWKRHRYLDHILTSTNVCLPSHLQLASNLEDPNVIFLHMNIHSVSICLHQAAILKAEQNNLGADIIKRSTERCYIAATDVSNIWRMISGVDISFLSPYVAFCLFVAARVFVHAYKRDPSSTDTRQSLHFLLNAMEAHRRRNDITESFMNQLLVDLDELGFDSFLIKRHQAALSHRDRYEGYRNEPSRCPPVMPKHSDTQPSFKEVMQQSETARLSTNARFRAGMFPDQHEPASLSMEGPDFEFNIPIRTNAGLQDVDLGHEYDMNSFQNSSGISPNIGQMAFSHEHQRHHPRHPAFGNTGMQPGNNQAWASPNAGATGGQGFDFNAPPEFDVTLLNVGAGEFNMAEEDVMQDLQGWSDEAVHSGSGTSMRENSFPNGEQTSEAAGILSFM